jgi:hypothetical protein
MIIHFSNDDSVALNAWLNTDLGQKFLRALENRRPRITGTELNELAVAGAKTLGFDLALEEIDSLRRTAGKNVTDVKFIDTHTD